MKLWSFIRFFFGGTGSKSVAVVAMPQAQAETSSYDPVASVKVLAHWLVRGGYYERADIIQSVEECAAGKKIPNLDSGKLVDTEIKALKSEQENWPSVTDNDRLDAAMQALEDNGIVARQNFACCQTCGHAEIENEVRYYCASGRKARGYAFFHEQSTEHAVAGGGVRFAYGTVGDSDSPVSIASDVADAMRRAGLKVDWNGKGSMCVMVGLDWKRRWTSD